MNTEMLKTVQAFLEQHPALAPTASFQLGEAQTRVIADVTVSIVGWVDAAGNRARGGVSYYVFPDGTVLVPAGGSGAGRETEASLVERWRSLVA